MGYQRRVHGAFFSGFYLQELRMKTINISQQVAIPDGIKCSVKARTVTVTGPRGSLTKSFRHLKVDICKVDKKTLKGEKFVRKVRMHPGVECKNSGQKDELVVEGNDLEAVSQSAALIQQSTTVRNKDIRKFLDGMYVSERKNIVEDEV